MKSSTVWSWALWLLSVSLISGCCRPSCDVWEDTKTAGRYVGKGFRTLGGKHGRQCNEVCSREDFCQMSEDYCEDVGYDFEPLQDAEEQGLLNMQDIRMQPRKLPGEPGSKIPGVESFIDPATDPQLRYVFQNVEFGFDSSVVKGEANLSQLRKVAEYLKSNPNVYIFLEGHCDQKGPQAYNLALGSRRANAVKKILIDLGADKDHIFTVSYGKEKLLVYDDSDEGCQKNRRVEFKVYKT
jgi:peptidoglycan-associated lipoprotein